RTDRRPHTPQTETRLSDQRKNPCSHIPPFQIVNYPLTPQTHDLKIRRLVSRFARHNASYTNHRHIFQFLTFPQDITDDITPDIALHILFLRLLNDFDPYAFSLF